MSRISPSCLSILALVLMIPGVLHAAEPPRVVFDFETGDLQPWRVVEGEFGDLVCRREFFFNRPTVRYNKQGKFYLSTLERDGLSTDLMVGVIESPVFVLRGNTAALLVGGGSHADTYVALCTEDGREVFYARGKNDETMQRVRWDVGKLVGRRVFLRVVDHNTGGWGHLTFDDFSAEGEIDREATLARFASSEKQRREAEARAACRAGPRAGQPAGLRPADRLRRPKPVQAGPPQHGDDVPDRPDQHGQLRRWRGDQDDRLRPRRRSENAVGGARRRGAGPGSQLRRPQGALLDASQRGGRLPPVRNQRRRVGLAQLTDGSGLSDIDPIYLPDGRILFTSTRETKFCMCNRHVMGNLYVIRADGTGIEQIGHSTLHEGHPSLLPDGRVIYDRWEYVDRNFGDAQGVWSVQPRRHQPRDLLGQQHELARRGARRPGDPRHGVAAGQLLVVPRSAVGRAGRGRPPARARRPHAGASHLAGRRDRPDRRRRLRHVQAGQGQSTKTPTRSRIRCSCARGCPAKASRWTSR